MFAEAEDELVGSHRQMAIRDRSDLVLARDEVVDRVGAAFIDGRALRGAAGELCTHARVQERCVVIVADRARDRRQRRAAAIDVRATRPMASRGRSGRRGARAMPAVPGDEQRHDAQQHQPGPTTTPGDATARAALSSHVHLLG